MDAPSSEAVRHEWWARTGMFGLGCRACLEEPESALRTQTTHMEHPSTRPKEGNPEHQTCAQRAPEGRAKETQPVIPQGSDLVHTGREGSDHSSHKPGVGENKAQQGQSYVSDSHYKNSVYWINKFTSLFLWMTSVCTTHGRHPRWSSFSVFVYNSVKRHTKCQLPNQNRAL